MIESALNYFVTVFHHRWDRLRSGQTLLNALNVQVQNMIDGKTFGLEASIAGQDVLNRMHADFNAAPGRSEIAPSLLLCA